MSAGAVRDGDHVVLRRDDSLRAVRVERNRKVNFEKKWFFADRLIGATYGATFDITGGGNLQPLGPALAVKGEGAVSQSGVDNRNIRGDGSAQKLTSDDISALKEQGLHGTEIVSQLVENSSTFKEKTEFSQQKYIKRKKKKYESHVTVLRPNARLLATMYHSREPAKICHLRVDSLSQLLALGNVRASGKLIVVETCSGLVLGAVLERMGGHGTVLNLHAGATANTAATEHFGFPESVLSRVFSVPLAWVGAVARQSRGAGAGGASGADGDVGDNHPPEGRDGGRDATPEAPAAGIVEPDRRRLGPDGAGGDKAGAQGESRAASAGVKDLKSQKELRQEERKRKADIGASELARRNADGLIVACKLQPWPILDALLQFLSPSRPFVIYCQHREPLLDCYANLKERGNTVSLHLTESWLRLYQVLPNRTHPLMSTSASGGYLLTGITVAPDTSLAEGLVVEQSVVERPRVEGLLVEKPMAEDSMVEGPLTECPVAEGPVMEEPMAEGPVAEGPVAEGPVAEGPVAEGLVAEGPVAEGPVAEGPAAEGSVVEGPAAEGSVVEGPAAEGPAAEGPAAVVMEECDEEEEPKTKRAKTDDDHSSSVIPAGPGRS